ncbi:hypothetical protein RRG08_045774 [Elysia crispata]|uniref:Uncharacterized protein n=1 Tax=Elysia crispata TaxID=231223 RepID=A0AAE1B1G6_9GAST|nr:hypothetical protein RRG08_045774 [Elysia crispata]
MEGMELNFESFALKPAAAACRIVTSSVNLDLTEKSRGCNSGQQGPCPTNTTASLWNQLDSLAAKVTKQRPNISGTRGVSHGTGGVYSDMSHLLVENITCSFRLISGCYSQLRARGKHVL